MAKIIEFPVVHSTAYNNLTQLFAICESSEALEEYFEIMAVCAESGNFLPGETEDLAEQVRAKRIELEKPAVKKADYPGLYMYCLEMGQQKPECQIEAQRSYGSHYHIDTPLKLKGRGVEYVKTLEDKNLNTSGKYMIGWNEYRVTEKAFEKLCKEYSISMQDFLD